MTDRNWLIRTSQNQILGPVAKQKLVEFVQKGSLGLLDEVSSGNGYWFSLNETELVQRYIYGDLPQGYNPISESRSVLAKNENPNKTTSINSSPANQVRQTVNPPTSGTQIIKLDLESFNAPQKPTNTAIPSEPTKLPNQEDLEFPDVDFIASSVSVSFENGDLALKPLLTSVKIPMPIPKPSNIEISEPVISEAEVILPDDDDLAFPDMDDKNTSPKIVKGKVDLSHQHTRTVALDIQQASTILPHELDIEDFGEKLSFEVSAVSKTSTSEEKEAVKAFDQAHKGASSTTTLKVDRHNTKAHPIEDKKLIHDRPTKSSLSKGAALRDPNRENHSKEVLAVPPKRSDNYIFFILIILILIIFAIFFYFTEILNKPLPM